MSEPPAPVPTRDGATVMLVRDGDHANDPLEVFMLRRHPSTAFGSVHVFPGGVVDAADHDVALDERCPGLDDAAASARLGVPDRRPGVLGGGRPRGVRGGRGAAGPRRDR